MRLPLLAQVLTPAMFLIAQAPLAYGDGPLSPQSQLKPAATITPVVCHEKAHCTTPASTQKIEVVMSQPEVTIVAPPRSSGDSCKDKDNCAEGKSKSKNISFLNFNCTKSKEPKGRPAARQESVTTVVPAFATATIPIAVQSTRFFSAESSAVGVRRESFTRADIESFVRESISAENTRVRNNQESAKIESAKTDCCAELKTRIEGIEKRLSAIDVTIAEINKKLPK